MGAFTKQKRQDLVIKAVSKLDNVNLLLVGGGGDHEEKLRILGSKLLGKRFSMKQVGHHKMPGIYRQCDMFTLVSAPSEAFGIVYVEAMASGLPVVALDDEIRREIIGDAGELIRDPSNSKEYARILKRVLTKDWGDKPRTQVDKVFGTAKTDQV